MTRAARTVSLGRRTNDLPRTGVFLLVSLSQITITGQALILPILVVLSKAADVRFFDLYLSNRGLYGIILQGEAENRLMADCHWHAGI